jgi:hypothetical protein
MWDLVPLPTPTRPRQPDKPPLLPDKPPIRSASSAEHHATALANDLAIIKQLQAQRANGGSKPELTRTQRKAKQIEAGLLVALDSIEFTAHEKKEFVLIADQIAAGRTVSQIVLSTKLPERTVKRRIAKLKALGKPRKAVTTATSIA